MNDLRRDTEYKREQQKSAGKVSLWFSVAALVLIIIATAAGLQGNLLDQKQLILNGLLAVFAVVNIASQFKNFRK